MDTTLTGQLSVITTGKYDSSSGLVIAAVLIPQDFAAMPDGFNAHASVVVEMPDLTAAA